MSFNAIFAWFQTPTPWIIMAILLFVMWKSIGSKTLGRVGLSKRMLTWIVAIGLVLTLGGSAFIGLGSIGSGVSATSIAQLQTTASYQISNATGTACADVGTDDTRASDFYLAKLGATNNPYIDTGVFLLTRSGKLDADSCQVSVIKPPRYDISDTTYHIVDEDADTGVMYAYIYTGSTTDTADSADPKETNMLAFAEGVSQGFVAFNITIDETGFDVLSQYDVKPVRVNMCGYNYVFNIHQND